MDIGDRLLKDGKPGTVAGDGDGEHGVMDITLDDGTETYIRCNSDNRVPDHRIKILKEGDQFFHPTTLLAIELREKLRKEKAQ